MKSINRLRAPFFLQIYQFATHPAQFLESCSQRYGDIFTTKWPGSNPIVFISNPQAIEQVCKAPKDTFNIGETYEFMRALVGNRSLMLLEKKAHHRQRSLIMPPLHGESLRSYGEIIYQLTKDATQDWRLGDKINITSWAQTLSIKVMLSVIFGLEEKELSELRHKIAELLDCYSSPTMVLHHVAPILRQDLGSWSPWGSFTRLRQEVDRLLYAEITRRRKRNNKNNTDVLSLLMNARDEEGELLSDVELRDHVITLLSGKGVAANAILFGLYSVVGNLEIGQKLQNELDSLDDFANLDAVAKLTYLTAVVKETLRLYPLTAVAMRSATKSFELMGHKLAKNTSIFMDLHSLHHRSDLFPNPKQFKPERFLNKKFTSYEYAPFGGGNRRCIAYSFAPFQTKLILGTIMSSYQLELADKRPIKLVRQAAGVAPERNIYLKVTGYRKQKSANGMAIAL